MEVVVEEEEGGTSVNLAASLAVAQRRAWGAATRKS